MTMPFNHNHEDKEVQPYGQCPGCDHYWVAATVLACDICGAPQWEIANVKIWELGVFDEPELYNNSALWGLCFTCADFIEADDWLGLVSRSIELHSARREVSMIPKTWRALLKHTPGSVIRDARPEDFGRHDGSPTP